MSEPLPARIPDCAVNLLARPEWYTDPGVVTRARLSEAGFVARFLSSKRFAGAEISAITLGRTINIRKMERYDPHSPRGLALLAHELKHVEQYERYGRVRFYLKYLSDYLRHGYGENEVALEAEAYQLERQVKKHLEQEFADNPGRKPCLEMAEPHTPDPAFAKTTPEEFHFPG